MIDRVQDIHSSIVKAICEIKTTLHAVSKSNRNQHGGYSFASTDDIYAALTKKMGEVGLLIMPLEVSTEIKRIDTVDKDGKPKIAQWLNVVYQFVLATQEATWSDPHSRRTLYIQVTGPQTFQAAASFAEKAYLRSLFKLPTGDMDLDSLPQSEFEEDQVTLAGNGKKRKSSAGAKRDGTTEVFNEIKTAFETAPSAKALMDLHRKHADVLNEMPTQWNTLLTDTYEDKMTDFGRALS